jgi:tetratricopeptide (TPR) repeat protein
MLKQLTASGALAGMKLKEVIRISLLTIAIGASAALLVNSTVASAQQLSKWRTEDKDACVNKGNAFSKTARIGGCTALLSSDLPKEYAPYAFYNRGVALQTERDYDRAIADYTDALRLKPDFAHALYNRGLAHQTKGDHDRAIADYTEAIRLNPAYFRAYKNRGLGYKAMGDTSDANSDLNEASRLSPTKPQ